MNKSGAGATGSGGMGERCQIQLPTMGGGDKNGKTGAIIGIIVIVIILIIGALYFWGERLVGTPNEGRPRKQRQLRYSSRQRAHQVRSRTLRRIFQRLN